MKSPCFSFGKSCRIMSYNGRNYDVFWAGKGIFMVNKYGYIRVSSYEQKESVSGVRQCPLPDSFYESYQLWKSGEITCTEAAKMCQMPLSTFRYRAEIYQKVQGGVVPFS